MTTRGEVGRRMHLVLVKSFGACLPVPHLLAFYRYGYDARQAVRDDGMARDLKTYHAAIS